MIDAMVRDNELRRRMLEFLKEQGVIYEEGPLYKLDRSALDLEGINYDDVRRGRRSSAINKFLNKWENWLRARASTERR